MRNLQEILNDSEYWVNYDDEHFQNNSKPLKIERETNPLQVTITNTTDKPIPIYAVVLADFYLSAEEYNLVEVLEHGWLQASATGMKKVGKSTWRNKVFMRRDQNQYSFKKEYGYLPGSIVSEWFSLLRFDKYAMVFGASTTAKQFTVIYVKKTYTGYRIRITCQFDEQVIHPEKTETTEKVWWGQGDEETQLANYAYAIAEEMKIEKVKPRVKALCCSYYWNGNYIDEELINKELDAIEKFEPRLELDYIQLDAGYSSQWGDWLDTKERFPNGLDKMANKIMKMGYKPGIWLAPFVANPRSALYRDKNHWFLKDNKGKDYEARFTTPIDRYIESMSYRTLDPTHPEVENYLRETFGKFREWGYTYYKLDFMYPVCLFKNYYKNMTRAEALSYGMQLIREAIGEDAYILTAVSPLSPLVGIVDSARMGVDTLTPFLTSFPRIQKKVNNYMLNQNLNSNLLRKHFNNILWVNDPDVLIFRDGTGLEQKLIDKHYQFAINNKTNIFIGDSIANLSPKNKEKLHKFINKL